MVELTTDTIWNRMRKSRKDSLQRTSRRRTTPQSSPIAKPVKIHPPAISKKGQKRHWLRFWKQFRHQTMEASSREEKRAKSDQKRANNPKKDQKGPKQSTKPNSRSSASNYWRTPITRTSRMQPVTSWTPSAARVPRASSTSAYPSTSKSTSKRP